MDNTLKILYMIMGISIFIMALTLLNILNNNLSNYQKNIMNKNVDYEIIRMVD